MLVIIHLNAWNNCKTGKKCWIVLTLSDFFVKLGIFSEIFSKNYGHASRHNKRKPIRFDENGLELGVTTQFHHTNQVWKESFRKTFVKMHRNQEINVLFWFQSWATGPNFVLKYLFTRARVGLKFSVLHCNLFRFDGKNLQKRNLVSRKLRKSGPKVDRHSTEMLDSWLSYLMMNWRP